jgi:HAMP domain-containing protein
MALNPTAHIHSQPRSARKRSPAANARLALNAKTAMAIGCVKNMAMTNRTTTGAWRLRMQVRMGGYGAERLQNRKYASLPSRPHSQMSIRNRLLLLVLASTVGGGVSLRLMLAMVMPASIAKPIKMLSEAAISMSTGNLHQKVPVKVRDFGGLAETMERMRISLKPPSAATLAVTRRQRQDGTRGMMRSGEKVV